MKTTMQELIDWIEGTQLPKEGAANHIYEKAKKLLEEEKEYIGQFMNWFIKHYSTATIDGMFGWVNSMDEEVTLKEILDEFYNQNK